MARKTARRTARRTARSRRMRGGGERNLGFTYTVTFTQLGDDGKSKITKTVTNIGEIEDDAKEADVEVGLEEAIKSHLTANGYTGVGPVGINFKDKMVTATFEGTPGVPGPLPIKFVTKDGIPIRGRVTFSEAPGGGRRGLKTRGRKRR